MLGVFYPRRVLCFFGFIFLIVIFSQNKDYSATCREDECVGKGTYGNLYKCESNTMCCSGQGCPSRECIGDIPCE